MEKGGNYEWDSLSGRPLCVMSTHYKTQFKGPGLYDTIGNIVPPLNFALFQEQFILYLQRIILI